MNNQNKIYGINFSSPPKRLEVLKLILKLNSKLKSSKNIDEDRKNHTQIINDDLLKWNFIDANEFRKIYDEESIKELNSSPHEGGIIKQWLVLIVLVLFIVLVGFFIFSGNKNNDSQDEYYRITRESQRAVEAVLKDSDSAKFKDQIYNCGLVNAKNAFGAYVGFKRYVVAHGTVFLEGTNANASEMTELWENACKH